jgi:spore maturation protein CgeB
MPGQPWKRWLQSISWVDALWGMMRREELHAAYRRRRERYWSALPEIPSQNPATISSAIQTRLAQRGYFPLRKSLGQVHTFAFVPKISWHAALYPDLAELGPLSWYDYAQYGYRWDEFRRGDRRAVARRREMLAHFLQCLQAAHRERPVDWLFVYASGVEITAQTILHIQETLGIPTVNLCLDDKQSWQGPRVDGCRFGQIDLAPVFDLSWTSARVACQWYFAEGGRAVYLPEGFDYRRFRPLPVPKDIAVSFVGGSYGFRRRWIRQLKHYGIPVQCYGNGWPSGPLSDDEMVRIINRSIINLGVGGIGYSESLTNVKGRDFEIPGTGGGLYLTTFNADLAQHYHIGQEIACYHSLDELIEQVRYYLHNVDEALAMAQRARQRCLNEHRWLHRYQTVCRILGILADPLPGEHSYAASHHVAGTQWS